MTAIYLIPAEGIYCKVKVDADIAAMILIIEKTEDKKTIEICLPRVTHAVLLRVLEFCSFHRLATECGLKVIHAHPIRIDRGMLIDVIAAANCMKIPFLLDLSCELLSKAVKTQTPTDIRKMFNITIPPVKEQDEF